MKRKLLIENLTLSWESLLDDLLLIKQVEGCRERTIKDYKYHVNLFFKEYPNALEDAETLLYSVRYYFSKECAPGTFNLRREYLKAFFSYLVNEDVIQKNPITFVKRKDEGKIYEIPVEKIEKLLNMLDKKTFTGLRDYCMILLALDTGIRPSEALKLRIDDINFESLEITIRKENAKTKTSRTLPISPLTAIYLKKLAKARPDNSLFGIYIFCSTSGQIMIESSWAHKLKHYSKLLCISITPYSLRHCFALYYLRNGGNVFTLQRTMGHKDLNMTKRYLALTDKDLKRELQLASPVNQFCKKKINSRAKTYVLL